MTWFLLSTWSYTTLGPEYLGVVPAGWSIEFRLTINCLVVSGGLHLQAALPKWPHFYLCLPLPWTGTALRTAGSSCLLLGLALWALFLALFWLLLV